MSVLFGLFIKLRAQIFSLNLAEYHNAIYDQPNLGEGIGTIDLIGVNPGTNDKILIITVPDDDLNNWDKKQHYEHYDVEFERFWLKVSGNTKVPIVIQTISLGTDPFKLLIRFTLINGSWKNPRSKSYHYEIIHYDGGKFSSESQIMTGDFKHVDYLRVDTVQLRPDVWQDGIDGKVYDNFDFDLPETDASAAVRILVPDHYNLEGGATFDEI